MMAFWLIWLPHVAPTSVIETWVAGTWPIRARAFDTAALVAACWAGGSLVRSACTWAVRLPRTCTVAPGRPALEMALSTSDTVAPWEATSHEVPPLKSMPQLNPRVPIDTRPATMMIPDTAYHHLRRP